MGGSAVERRIFSDVLACGRSWTWFALVILTPRVTPLAKMTPEPSGDTRQDLSRAGDPRVGACSRRSRWNGSSRYGYGSLEGTPRAPWFPAISVDGN